MRMKRMRNGRRLMIRIEHEDEEQAYENGE